MTALDCPVMWFSVQTRDDNCVGIGPAVRWWHSRFHGCGCESGRHLVPSGVGRGVGQDHVRAIFAESAVHFCLEKARFTAQEWKSIRCLYDGEKWGYPESRLRCPALYDTNIPTKFDITYLGVTVLNE